MDSSVEDAIKKAKYNEAVVVSLTNSEDPSSPPEEVVLIAQLDDVNGGITWNRVQASSSSSGGNDDDDVGILQHLRTKRWVLPMLNDHCRNNLYDEAIRAASKEALRRIQHDDGRHGKSSNPTIRALDIGSGTGLLAMMTAHHLQEEIQQLSEINQEFQENKPTIQVTSLEMSSAMARLARLTIASNDLASTIDVVEAYSLDISLEQKANLCTSELLESGLLGEGVLPSLRDAWRRLLRPDAVVVPQRARVFAQVLEGRECIGKYWGPRTGGANETLRLSLSADETNVMIGDANDGIIVPLHAEKLLAPSDGSSVHGKFLYATTLCEPVEVLAFSFTSRDDVPDQEGRTQTTCIVPTKTGTAHGILFWWELDLWDGLTYSTECGKRPWQDHWHQCLYVFPTPDSECPQLIEGETRSLVVHHDDFRISFEIMAEEQEQSMKLKRQRSEIIPAVILPQRAFQLNNKSRTDALRAAVAFALADRGVDSAVLDLSDFSLCAILAALEGALNVVSVESSTGTVAQTSARVAQLANCLPRTGASFQVLQCYPEQLTIDAIPGLGEKQVEIVVAEPYYEILEGWHLQEAMNFYFLVRALKMRRVINDSAAIVPAFAVVRGVAISCPELWRAYACCGDGTEDARVRGFKHDIVNRCGVRFDDNAMCFPSWQYNVTRLTESFELGRLHFEGSTDVSGNESSVPFSKAGICHGLMVWVEYGLRISEGTDEKCFRYYSTVDRCHQQMIRFLSEPAVSDENSYERNKFEWKATFGGPAGMELHSFNCAFVEG